MRRGGYLAEVAGMLWPAPVRVHAGRGRGSRRARPFAEYVVLPHLADPRLVLPLRHPRAAATLARGYAEATSRAGRARGHALALAAASGAAPVLFRDRLRIETETARPDTIETVLGELAGRSVTVGMHVSRPRANRKPVVHALTPDGELVTVAKVATNELTHELLDAEETAIRLVSGRPRRTFTVPTVVGSCPWREVDVLALSPLPVDAPRVPFDVRRLATVAVEIAATAGLESARLPRSAYLTGLRKRIAELPDATADRLRPVLELVLDRHGDRPLVFGAWHGDFAKTNLAMLRDTVLVWDWERHESGVPLGFDMVHYHAQQRMLAPGEDVGAFVATLPDRVAPSLAAVGLDGHEARTVTRLYLVEIVTRYVHDRQDEIGTLGSVLPRLLTALESDATLRE
ncbi:MAG TPA: hypothetical protein VF053_18100 [Streptosporangiales bacterium]